LIHKRILVTKLLHGSLRSALRSLSFPKGLQGKAAKRSFGLTGISFSLGYERTDRLLENAVRQQVELGKRTHRGYKRDEPKEQEDEQIDFTQH